MSQLLFLIPPSEGKARGGLAGNQHISFALERPSEIACNASEKDLKCSGKRYAEAIALNRSLDHTPVLPAIERYSGVMYQAIGYARLQEEEKRFFDEHFLIMSGMYGLLRPQDQIANYKLPIASKGLYAFWGEKIIKQLTAFQAYTIVSLLPDEYLKLITGRSLQKARAGFEGQLIQLKFLDEQGKRLTHHSKPIKGQWIRAITQLTLSSQKDIQRLLQLPGYHIEAIPLLP
ncbi:MAG: peroxide stress protein YaaA [bacterium]|nr:peroxide stress protein YaaA [bacterium]